MVCRLLLAHIESGSDQEYRLVTKNTYEAEMFERAIRKLGLNQAIFMDGVFKRPEEQLPEQRKLTKQEVEILLRKGILGLVGNEGQNRNL
jgi:chromodomain-helicase-DNA-binding protein 7